VNGSPLEFRRLGAAAARESRATVEAIYRGAYAAAIESGDPFEQPGAFMGRFDSYAANPLLDLVIGYRDGELAGQAWGWPLTARSGWWADLESEPEPGFAAEDGTRTFALSEIMVIRELTGHGIAHALHDELLRDRREQRATLLVDPVNDTANRAYRKWGWQKVSQLRPHWPDAPQFDVLMLPLPLR
jgi:ribosomal protein S18 acetylase RimI-like enzyme